MFPGADSSEREKAFEGTLPHTPILYDCFSPKFTDRAAFHILTHLHADHCTGLKNNWKGAPIYCSVVTRRLLLSKWNIDPSMVIGLQYHTVHSIPFVLGSGKDQQQEQCSIELFDANHCAGSAMFLLKGYFGTYFLSGDFRFSSSMGKKLIQRQIQNEEVDCLVLDSTFSDSFWNFPTQSDSIRQVVSLIQKHPHSEVYIESEMLGLEPILVTIAKHFHSKIHVDDKKWKATKALPGVLKFFTLNEKETRFHVCPHKSFSSLSIRMKDAPLRFIDKSRKASTTPPICIPNSSMEHSHLFIKPSTMWFGANRHNIPNLRQFHREPVKANDAWHVLHSIHSSYEELLEFVKIIRPRKIIPWTECSSSTLEVMNGYLNPSSRQKIVIPYSLATKFSFLSRQEGEDVSVESQYEAQMQKHQIQPQIHSHSRNPSPNTNEQKFLSCWSPSPPSNHETEEEDDDCIMLEDFEFPICKGREREQNLGELDFSPPEKRRRIGW